MGLYALFFANFYIKPIILYQSVSFRFTRVLIRPLRKV